MSGWNLPPGVTLNDIDALFEESDEDQCLDTEVEDQLTEEEAENLASYFGSVNQSIEDIMQGPALPINAECCWHHDGPQMGGWTCQHPECKVVLADDEQPMQVLDLHVIEDLLDSSDPGLGCRNLEAEQLGAPVEVSAERTAEAMLGGKYIGLFGIVIGLNEATGECLVSLDETSHARFIEIEQAGFSEGLRDLDEDQWFCSGILEVVKQDQ